MQMQNMYARQSYRPAPIEFLNLNRAAMYQQRRYMPELMMLDLQRDLAEELGMRPDLELMQLDEIDPLEATDDLEDLEDQEEEDLEDLMTKEGEKIKSIFKAANNTLGKLVGDHKCFYKVDGSGSIYATSAEDNQNK